MKVCELLTDKTKWTQFAVARDADPRTFEDVKSLVTMLDI
jgi:hypothetical protein